jgi:indole-3-glycerol phosphate synthase
VNILDKLVQAAAARLERDKAEISEAELINRCAEIKLIEYEFEAALRSPGISLICEIKRASPSKGVLTDDFPYIDIALDYEAGGASAISVVTETDYFLGSDGCLKGVARAVKLPVLRKDFITDAYQIYQAKAIGAKAILLIAAILQESRLKEFIALADEIGLSVLAEVHNESELKTAALAGARIIGVNNRNLKTFEVDLQNSIRLRKLASKDVIFVAESGIRSAEDIALLAENGIDAALIGEILMKADDRKREVERLKYYNER